MSVNPIPEGYHSLTPYLYVKDARKFLEFIKNAFDAEVKSLIEYEGVVGHAEILIGNSMLMLSEATKDMNPPQEISLYLYVPDCDATYKKALDAGATSEREPADQFYGDRNSGVKDFAGNTWWIATHVENISSEEMERRIEEDKKNMSEKKDKQ